LGTLGWLDLLGCGPSSPPLAGRGTVEPGGVRYIYIYRERERDEDNGFMLLEFMLAVFCGLCSMYT
jgi:hypothetical protein